MESRFTVGSLESGAHLCEAYELYVELDVPVHISFEHACFLLQALARREELSVVRCGVCGGVHLRDLLSKRRNGCSTCASPGFAAAEVRMLEPC